MIRIYVLLDSSKAWLGVGLHRYCFCLDTVIHLLGGKPVDIILSQILESQSRTFNLIQMSCLLKPFKLAVEMRMTLLVQK